MGRAPTGRGTVISTPSTTPVPVNPTSPSIPTTTIVTTTTTSVIVVPKVQPPTLTFWDHLAIFGNYAVSFVVFMGQLASYLYRQYSQVNMFLILSVSKISDQLYCAKNALSI